jgi:hypothetical protein
MSTYNPPDVKADGSYNTVFNTSNFAQALGAPVLTTGKQDIGGTKIFQQGAVFQQGLNVKGGLTANSLTLSGAITNKLTTVPTYGQYDIGYTITNQISAKNMTDSATATTLSTITLPCYGVWFINFGVSFINNGGANITLTDSLNSILQAAIANAANTVVTSMSLSTSTFTMTPTTYQTINDSLMLTPSTSNDLTVKLNFTSYKMITGANLQVMATTNATYPNMTYFVATRIA